MRGRPRRQRRRALPAGSSVVVRLAAEGSKVVLTVTDAGTGIVGVEPQRVFDRFTHADAPPDPSGQSRPGFGLGLALVRDIATRQGGTVRVVSTSPAGTTFRLELPAAR
ncbi:hypothetical protein GCM10025867_33750 [Frondihabitans sucicola]|uniref:histidine kinase n=1 Tax=Frondihabitans sucicola TaxID=1268041 RepID=A0ABM8GRP6_9MICO|nr:hypothetical protein GCM10025867_33750 [Frondihabitans sucicola]